VFRSQAYNYDVGPSFRWALFQAGRIRANIASSECAVGEALATYEQTLLLAAEEVEDSVVAFEKEIERRKALERSVDAAQKSLESVLEIYRAGNTDFQNVLVTQQTLFVSQNRLAESQGQVVVNLVSFYKALGGGWDPVYHCEPQCVRLPCPPDCPTEAAPTPIPKKSYLLNDAAGSLEGYNSADEEAEIEDERNDEPNADDSDADDSTGIPAESTDEALQDVNEGRSEWPKKLVPWRGIAFLRSDS
jgi:hypothetical protein